MHSTMMTFVRQSGCAPKTFCRATCAIVLSVATVATAASPVSALVIPSGGSLQQQLKQDSPITEVRARGAALGFVAAATAAAWAGPPPVPGYCWYYTDLSRTQGFWDACP
jgi:hypothetical protein